MRILITGAKGFLGSVFSLRALERGHMIIALDDESRGENPVEHKLGNGYIKHDCRHGFGELRNSNWSPGGRPLVDVVAHFAAATGSLERPLDELIELNVDMTMKMYDDALRHGAHTFLWPTTSLALGVPDSPYVESKEMALRKLREVDAKADIGVPVRFFNVAGAYKGFSELRKNEVHLIPEMMRLHAREEPLVINGDDYETVDGTPSRDFVHVLDVVEYLLDIAEKRITPTPHADDGAIWLGKGASTTVRQAVSIYEQFAGTSMQTRIGPRRAFDCGSLTVDPFQAEQFRIARGGCLTPAWVSIRDEAIALAERRRTWWNEKNAEEIKAAHQHASVLADDHF